MLRNFFCAVMAIRIIGPLWSAVASLLIIAGAVGLLHLVWHLLLTATMPI